MKTVFRIFFDDIKSLSRRFFASAVIVAISILPALYAWVNIYANGNPYANTGEIKIALASYDPGIDLEDGTHVNMADEVFEEMKGSDKINWQFPKTPTDAINGVKSGEYYAAIIFEDNFTYNMYNFEQALLDEKAPLTYYENAKANAIAPKITETAAGNLQDSIKTKYLETVFSYVFDGTGEIADELTDGDAVDSAIAGLENLRDSLRAYDKSISAFTKESKNVKTGISNTSAKLKQARASARQSANEAKTDLAQARKSVSELKTALDARTDQLKADIAALEDAVNSLNAPGLTEEQRAEIQKTIEERASALIKNAEDYRSALPSGGGAASEAARLALDNIAGKADSLRQNVSDPDYVAKRMAEIKNLRDQVLDSAVQSVTTDVQNTLAQLAPLTLSISNMLDSIDPVLVSAGDTVTALDDSLRQTQKVLRASADDIDDLIEKVKAAEDDEKIELLANILGGDPEEYARFFSNLVNVEVEEVYSVASYGAAMAPFYSVLAIWVGGVILVAILKTHIDRKKYPNATETEAFFGRFMLFFLLGQVQAAVIIAGDIFLLDCDPVHPWLMWLTAAVTSLVFTTLIYALTLSFGDIGKAMVVVFMVLQIAGSSGSYPIEILPPVFGKVYKFFPFPYAINAMREALCGMHGMDMYKYLAELSVFLIIGLAIGLLVRRPFIGINNFVSEKIEETELL